MATPRGNLFRVDLWALENHWHSQLAQYKRSGVTKQKTRVGTWVTYKVYRFAAMKGL